MGRPTNQEKDQQAYLKSQFEEINKYLNSLEMIGKETNEVQRNEKFGQIWMLVGKLMIRFAEMQQYLGVETN